MTEQSTKTTDRHGNKFWKLPNGDLHREDGPAIIQSSGTKQWLINGKLHREDGPAIEYSNGSKDWWIEGKLIYREAPND